MKDSDHSTWKQTTDPDDEPIIVLPPLAGSIVGIIVLIIVVICLKTPACEVIGNCLRAAGDICFKLLDCDCDCDSGKCLNCVSYICLSPCLFVNWLRRKYNERTHQNEQYQITQNRGNTSDMPVITVQPAYIQIPQTNINISIHHDDSRRSLTDDTFIDIIHDFNEDHIETDSLTSGTGWTVEIVPSTAQTGPTIDDVPPSYDEATEHDPPSYREAHRYPANYPPSYGEAHIYPANLS